MIALLFIALQGALFGYVAGLAFPGFPPEFWLSVVGNTATVVLYAMSRQNNI